MDKFKMKAIELNLKNQCLTPQSDTFWRLLENYIYCKDNNINCQIESVLAVCSSEQSDTIRDIIESYS